MKVPAVHLMRNLGLEPDPWQVEVLESNVQRLLLNCCRQAGNSTVATRAVPGLRSTVDAATPPEHRAHVAGVWGMPVEELPRGGVDCIEIFRRVDRGEIRGLLSICFNPIVSLPNRAFIEWMLERLEFFVTIDFFMSETARFADIVLPGSLHEEDEGTVTSAEGRVIKINQGRGLPR